jgi:hypothetical protein
MIHLNCNLIAHRVESVRWFYQQIPPSSRGLFGAARSRGTSGTPFGQEISAAADHRAISSVIAARSPGANMTGSISIPMACAVF